MNNEVEEVSAVCGMLDCSPDSGEQRECKNPAVIPYRGGGDTHPLVCTVHARAMAQDDDLIDAVGVTVLEEVERLEAVARGARASALHDAANVLVRRADLVFSWIANELRKLAVEIRSL